jgi:hypothetical protein
MKPEKDMLMVLYDIGSDSFLGPLSYNGAKHYKDYYKKLKGGSLCPLASVRKGSDFYKSYRGYIVLQHPSDAIVRSWKEIYAVPILGTSPSSEDHVLLFDQSILFIDWLSWYKSLYDN